MTRRHGASISDAQLVAFLEGELPPADARFVEQAVADSTTHQIRMEQLARIRSGLIGPVPGTSGVDLVERVRQTRNRTLAAAGFARWRWRAGALAAAAVALTSLLAVRAVPFDEFRSKSSPPIDGRGAEWASVKAYVTDGMNAAIPLSKSAHRGDGFVFSYTNIGPTPFSYLMVYAVDGSGEVRWFYPAYDRPGEDPASIAIQASVSNAELPTAIHHELALGRAYLHTVLSTRPFHVLEIEALHRRESDASAPIQLPNVSARVHPFEVTP